MKNREEEARVSNDAAAVINDRMMIIQQENEALTKEVMGLQKEIDRLTGAMEVIKDESYQKDFNKVTREILLHEKRIQEEQNKQLINRLQELKNKEEEKLRLNKEQDCEMKNSYTKMIYYYII